MTKEEYKEAFYEGFDAALKYVEDNPNTWRRYRGYGVDANPVLVAAKAPPYVPNHTAMPFDISDKRIEPTPRPSNGTIIRKSEFDGRPPALPLSSYGQAEWRGPTDAQILALGIIITTVTLTLFYIFTNHI